MTALPKCDHDELDRYSCPVCGPASTNVIVQEEPIEDFGPPFVARYSGRCIKGTDPSCPGIEPGDLVYYVAEAWTTGVRRGGRHLRHVNCEVPDA